MVKNNSHDRFMKAIYSVEGSSALTENYYDDGGPTRNDMGLDFAPDKYRLDQDNEIISIRGPWDHSTDEKKDTLNHLDYRELSVTELLSELEDQGEEF